MSSSSLKKQENKEVTPGDILAIIEEYDAGEGTYVDLENGVVRAAVAGIVYYDDKAKIVYVKPKKDPLVPRAGSSVIGVVTQVKHDVIILDLVGEVDLHPVPRFKGEFSGRFSGAINVANIADEYVKDIFDYYKLGDIVLARVLNNSNPYHLTTVPPQYGVIYATCSKCGGLLHPINNRSMKCTRCGRIEKRKVSALASSKILSIKIKKGLVVSLS